LGPIRPLLSVFLFYCLVFVYPSGLFTGSRFLGWTPVLFATKAQSHEVKSL